MNMAQGMLKESQLRLIFEVGVTEQGDPIFKGKNYNNLKREATTDQVHQAAMALAQLCDYPLSSVERNDSSDIIA